MKFKKCVLAATIAAAVLPLSGWAETATPSMEEMWAIIQQQQAEIKNLKGQLQSAQTKVQEIDLKVESTADAIEQGGVGASETLNKMAAWAEKTTIGGYGEHHFNHIEDGDDQVDAHRYVLYFGHQFTDKVRFFSEFELEHGIAGEGEDGEIELEQAYIQWDFAEKHSLTLGQFLVPVGILNETHEPDTFYGVERNKVEAEIIPATWWETGAMVSGEVVPGFSYAAAVHSGLETDGFRIRSGRQKSSEATAEDLAFTGRLKYTGIPGLEWGLTVQHQQDISQNLIVGESAPATLLESHLIYNVGNFGFRALWAEWDIDSERFELADAAGLDGWYVEPSYKLTEKLGVFVRYSEWERGDKPLNDYETYDLGLNYWIHPRVVLKADITDSVGKNDEADGFNLGLGWSF